MARFPEDTIVVKPDDRGTFPACVPAISGCHAVGQTPDEARTGPAHLFQMIVEEYAEEGRTLPPRQADGCFPGS